MHFTPGKTFLWCLVGQVEIDAQDVDGELRLDAVLQAASLGGLAHAAVRGGEFLSALFGYLVEMRAQVFDVREQAGQELTSLVFVDIAIGPRF